MRDTLSKFLILALIFSTLSGMNKSNKQDTHRKRFIIPHDDAWTYLYRNNYNDAAKNLEGFITDDASLFRAGYAYVYSDEPQNAVAYLLKLPDSSWKFYAIGLAYYRAGKYDKAIEYLSSYDFQPHLAYRAQRIKYDALKASEDYDKANKQLDYLRENYPDIMGKRTYQLEKLGLYKESGDDERMIAQLKILLNTVDSYASRAAYLVREEKIPSNLNKKMGDAFYEGKKYALARKFYEKYREGSSGTPDGKVIFRIARCNDKTGRYTKALEQYREMKKQKLFDEGWAVFGIVRCLRKLNQYENALKELEQNRDIWEKSTAAPFVLWEGYEIGREKLDFAIAAKYAGNIAKKYPSHDLGDNGVVQAGLFNVMNKDTDAADEYFTFIHDSGKYSFDAFLNIGRYWSNRLNGSYEPSNEILTGLPDFYTYHMLSDSIHHSVPMNRTSLPEIDWVETIDTLHEVLRSGWFEIETLNETDPHLKWARFFAYWGMKKWARVEYEAFLDKNPNMNNSTAGLDLFLEFKEAGLTNMAYEMGLDIVTAYKRNIGEPPKILYRLSYPIFFEEQLNSQCPKSKVDPLFVLSVMRQESRYDSDARSYADARGLMQVMPKTGQNIANQLRSMGYETEQLYDPYLSIEFGAYLLGDLLNRMDGPYYALAAYNAGEAPVKRWKEIPMAQKDPLVFTEIIDYKQTRHYVRHVMENYFRYHDIWD